MSHENLKDKPFYKIFNQTSLLYIAIVIWVSKLPRSSSHERRLMFVIFNFRISELSGSCEVSADLL